MTLHRGPLLHLLLSYPSGRLGTRAVRVVAAAAYLDGAVVWIGRNDYVTIAVYTAAVITAAARHRASSERDRPATFTALALTGLVGLVTAVGAVERIDGSSDPVERAVLLAYDSALFMVAVFVTIDLLRSQWTAAAAEQLVLEVGERGAGATLRERLAAWLDDPTVWVGYWVPDGAEYVDGSGRVTTQPAGADPGELTIVTDAGRAVAAIQHAPGALADPRLSRAVESALRATAARSLLQAQQAQLAGEVADSRRRLLETADIERRRHARRRPGRGVRLRARHRTPVGAGRRPAVPPGRRPFPRLLHAVRRRDRGRGRRGWLVESSCVPGSRRPGLPPQL